MRRSRYSWPTGSDMICVFDRPLLMVAVSFSIKLAVAVTSTLSLTTELPAVDTPLVSGDLGWNYHTGGHTATPADWKAFLDFLGKYF